MMDSDRDEDKIFEEHEKYEKLLAAYLFDELDAKTRTNMAQALEQDSALRDQLADMRLALKILDQGAQEESPRQLSAGRRALLLGEVENSKLKLKSKSKFSRASKKRVAGSTHPRIFKLGWRKTVGGLAILAATFLLVFGLIFLVMPSLEEPQYCMSYDPDSPSDYEDNKDSRDWRLSKNADGRGEKSDSINGKLKGYKTPNGISPDDYAFDSEIKSESGEGGGGVGFGLLERGRSSLDPIDKTGNGRSDGRDGEGWMGKDFATAWVTSEEKLEKAKATFHYGLDKERLESVKGQFEKEVRDGLTKKIEISQEPLPVITKPEPAKQKDIPSDPALGDKADPWTGAAVPGVKGVSGWSSSRGQVTSDDVKRKSRYSKDSQKQSPDEDESEKRDSVSRGKREGDRLEVLAETTLDVQQQKAVENFKAVQRLAGIADSNLKAVVGPAPPEQPSPKKPGEGEGKAGEGKPGAGKPGSGKPGNKATTPAAASYLPKAHQGRVKEDPVVRQGQGLLPPASTFKSMPVNPWVLTSRDRLATFSLDVDTASYAMSRAYIASGYLPPQGAVRMEAFINNFDYNYPRRGSGVFNIFAQASDNPFDARGVRTKLLKVGVQGKVIAREGRKNAHLIFVVDTSGSMAQPDRLPLVQHAIKLLVKELDDKDHVSLITYGKGAQLLLEHVPVSKTDEIIAPCDKIAPGGSTNLLAGLRAGYELAYREFVAGQINRIILCSDGAANIGLVDAMLIGENVSRFRKQGITLTTVGVGYGGYNDDLMESLAKKGDGNYLFVDSPAQAHRVFVKNMTATLQTIAKDAKIQVEFNPNLVRRYRLVGYEKRDIADKDFRNDTIDAAEVGSGQSATALFELELIGSDREISSGLLGRVYVRYKDADTNQTTEISHRLDGKIIKDYSIASQPRFFMAACAGRFAEVMRQSQYTKHTTCKQISDIMKQVSQALPLDQQAAELLKMTQQAQGLPQAP